MKNRLFTPALLVAIVAGLLSGCGDAIFSETEVDTTQVTQFSKLRHDHLLRAKFLSRTKVLERYAELAATNDFVLGTSGTVLDMNKVLERYENLTGVTVKRKYRKVFKGFAAHATDVPGFLAIVEADPDIKWIEPDARVLSNKPKSSDLKGGNKQHLPWGVDMIDADISSAQAGNGSGSVDVDIFILDSGLKEHDANLAWSQSFVPSTDNTGDPVGHGTHVTGTAAAQDNSHGVVGVAPGANVYNFRVLDSNGQTELSTVIAAVEEITERKQANPDRPMVANISFGADVGTTEYNSLDQAIEASIAAGVVYVIAAGNEGIDASTVTPAHVSNAITVGAYNQQKQFASFSNFGSIVDLLAPGVDIESSSNATGAKQAPVLMSGTSMAAPHVTGAAALYLSKNKGASALDVVSGLKAASRDWVSETPAGTTTNSVYVGGF